MLTAPPPKNGAADVNVEGLFKTPVGLRYCTLLRDSPTLRRSPSPPTPIVRLFVPPAITAAPAATPAAPPAEASPALGAELATLSSLDDHLAHALEDGALRLLSSSWLKRQPEGYRIQRRQQLEALKTSPFLSATEAVALLRRGTRSIGVLSYGWLSAGDPDIVGERIQLLRATLAEATYIEALFWE